MQPTRNSLVYGLTLVATLGGLLFGYDTAVISGAVKSIDLNFIEPWGLAETARDALSGLTISSALLGCIIGSATAGVIGTAWGRKRGLLLASALFLISGVGSALPELGLAPLGGLGARALIPFIGYRIICGIGVGIASVLSPVYIAEIAPSQARGRLVSLNQMAIVLGMALVYFVNWGIASLGDATWLHAFGWRWMLGSEVIPALLFMSLLFLVPDTPRWLVMKGRDAAALGVLRKLVSETEAQHTLAEIRTTLVEPTQPLFAFGPRVIVLGILLSLFQQFVGINAVLYYAPLMFENMGATSNAALLQTLLVGGANVVFTLLATLTVDRWGRRPLMIGGALVMAGSMLALGWFFYSRAVGVAALSSVLVYIGGFALSWGPITWVLLAEIFPNSIKGKALALVVSVQWIANLFVSWSFKILDGNSRLNATFHHGAVYWLYGVMSLLAAFFMWRYVPETKRRSLESIQSLWGKPRP